MTELSKKTDLRFLIVDRHPLIRVGIQRLLRREYPNAIFGQAEGRQAAMKTCAEAEWSLMTLEIADARTGAIDLLEEMAAHHPRMRCIVVTSLSKVHYAVRVLRAGAAAYVSKDTEPEDLLRAVRKVLTGGKHVSESVAELLATAYAHDADRPLGALSNRELEVLRRIASGETVTQIATQQSLSVKTVSTYRSRVARKTGLTTDSDLTRYAMEHQLVP